MNDRTQTIIDSFKEFATLKHAMMKQAATFKPPVPPAQKEVLFMLAHNDGMSLKELAKQLDITPGATTQLTEALVQSDYINRQADKDDRRIMHLHVLAEGHTLIRKLYKSREDLFKKLFEGLSDDEIENFRAVLQKMNANLHDKK